MWKDFIERLEAECEFRPPASPADIKQMEDALGVRLPNSLRELLLETNGVYSRPMYNNVIWHTGEIIQRNTLMREDPKKAETYMTFESLLFFADAGVDGIMFAFPISATGIVQPRNIIAWYPIEDSRPVLAFGLKDYLTRWLTSKLTL